jgi:predicted ATPase with chaperone activity
LFHFPADCETKHPAPFGPLIAQVGQLSHLNCKTCRCIKTVVRGQRQCCAIDDSTMELLKFAMADLNLSARAYDRILKVARTMADLAGAEPIASEHVSEAIQYSSLDRQLWT